jgi:predicted enzyme related to lactoylglutathione lyase
LNLIAHVEIPVRELERAMAFYGALFGIGFGEIVELHASRMAWFPFTPGADGASGALAEGEAYVPTTDGAIVYFAVEDIDAALARAGRLGSTILFPKTPISATGLVAEITDSEGNRLALQSL